MELDSGCGGGGGGGGVRGGGEGAAGPDGIMTHNLGPTLWMEVKASRQHHRLGMEKSDDGSADGWSHQPAVVVGVGGGGGLGTVWGWGWSPGWGWGSLGVEVGPRGGVGVGFPGTVWGWRWGSLDPSGCVGGVPWNRLVVEVGPRDGGGVPWNRLRVEVGRNRLEVTDDRFYIIALFSALKQTHCARI